MKAYPNFQLLQKPRSLTEAALAALSDRLVTQLVMFWGDLYDNGYVDSTKPREGKKYEWHNTKVIIIESMLVECGEGKLCTKSEKAPFLRELSHIPYWHGVFECSYE